MTNIHQLIEDIQAAVRERPQLSGHLHTVITKAFQRAVPMVGTLEKTQVRYATDGWTSKFDAFRGLGQTLCGGTARCVDGDSVYNVDHTGAFFQGCIGDGKWTEEK